MLKNCLAIFRVTVIVRDHVIKIIMAGLNVAVDMQVAGTANSVRVHNVLWHCGRRVTAASGRGSLARVFLARRRCSAATVLLLSRLVEPFSTEER